MSNQYIYPLTDFVAAPTGPNLTRLDREVRADQAIVIALNGISLVGSDVVFDFKAALGPGDLAALAALIAAHTGAALPDPFTADGMPIVSVHPSQRNGAIRVAPTPLEGAETVYSTHNFADKCSWYRQSARVNNVALVDSGDGKTWGSAHTHWVDMYTGRIQDDDGLLAEEAIIDPTHHLWTVLVTVDGVAKTAREFGETTGGDYIVNYETGSVTFDVSQAGKDVRATYSYAQGSEWILRPLPGRVLEITDAEIQYSRPIEPQSEIQMIVRGLASSFAPQLGLPAGTKLDLYTLRYKRLRQMIDEARGAYPIIEPIGGLVRGTQTPFQGFPFKYVAARVLEASKGMELVLRVKYDRPMIGEHATGTFYCNSRSE